MLRQRRLMSPPDAHAPASTAHHTRRAGRPLDRLSRSTQVSHRVPANKARRPVLRTESCEPLADFVNLWLLIGQITRGDQRSDASLKLVVAHCHFFGCHLK